MAKFCTSCGAALANDKRFCTECGAAVPAAEAAPIDRQPVTAQTVPPPRPETAPVGAAPASDMPPAGSKYELISTGGCIGIMLLMCIPIIGQILMIIWACGGCRKLQKRNLARASLIMLAVMLIISSLIGLAAKSLFGKAIDAIEAETGISIGKIADSKDKDGESSNLEGLLGIMESLPGENEPANSDIEELEDLNKILESLGGVTGENSSVDTLIDGAIQANKDAEAINDGWPDTLRKYPGGTATAVASYRTEITGTTREEMLAWIEDLKGDGFTYQDFYNFGMTEEEMLNYGWWAYDGKTYLSVSFSDGTVIVDHTKELPDLESYFN